MYPFVGLLIKTSARHFFTNPQPCYITQLMYVNCMYIFMMFVILLLPLVSQWVVSKFCRMLLGLMFIKLLFRIGLQSFCSDVVVQNVNVISSPTCKVLCFKKNCVSPIKCFMLETSPFTVTPSIKLPSSLTLSLPSSSSLLSSSSSILTSALSSSSSSPYH